MSIKSLEGIPVNEQSKSFLKETAKWTKFIAIMGFIGVGFMIIVALIMLIAGASTLGGAFGTASILSSGVIAGLYLVLAILYFFPLMYLFKFSKNTSLALLSNDESMLTAAFENLKSHYKFIGIMMIVMISLYILMFLITIIAASSGAFM